MNAAGELAPAAGLPGLPLLAVVALVLVVVLAVVVVALGVRVARLRRRLCEVGDAYARHRTEQSALLDNAPAAVFIKDAEGRYQYVNRTFLDWYLAPAKSPLGLTDRDLFGDRGTDGAFERDRRVSAVGAALERESEITRADGSRHTEVTTAFTMAEGVGGYTTDITEFRRVTRELLKVFHAIEQVSASVIITDTTGAIEYVNPSFVEATGYRIEEVRGQNPRLLKSGFTTPEEYASLWQTIGRGGTWRGEFHNKRKDGSLFWEAATISPVRGDEGRVVGFVAVKEDISERKRIEAALRTAQEAAEIANEAKSRFLAMVSHELRTPLNAIIGFSEIIREGLYGPLKHDRYFEYLGDIHASGVHLLELINNILDVSRIESGRFALDEEIMDVGELVHEAVTLFRSRAADGQIHLRVRIETGLPAVLADRRALRQVVVSLLSNALKFTEAGGEVVVAARRQRRRHGEGAERRDRPDRSGGVEGQPGEGQPGEGRPVGAAGVDACDGGDESLEGEVIVTVADNGIGIASEHVAQLGRPFFQLDSSLARRYPGTGIGLSLARSLVERHGGLLTIASCPARGTTVTVRLPAERVVGGETGMAAALRMLPGGMGGGG